MRLEKPEQIFVGEMLDQLGGEDRADSFVPEPQQVAHRIALHDVEAALSRSLHHRRIDVHAPSTDSSVPHHAQEFPTAASQVQHASPLPPIRGTYGRQALGDLGFSSSEPVLEPDVHALRLAARSLAKPPDISPEPRIESL